ncbi:MAG: hypothetical protein J5441_00845 [Clostridia bacterium]|nr:hypothetical protein [Clostridia bacterium]
MKRSCVKGFISLICNVAVVAFTVVCVVGFFTRGGDGNMEVAGFTAFKYFTVDSNVLAAVAALCMLPWSFKTMLGGRKAIKKSVLLFKFVATAAVTLTLFTVLFLLGPKYGYKVGMKYGYALMYDGNNIFMHMISPLLMIISFCFAECKGEMRFRDTLLGLIPTVAYGAVYTAEVMLFKGWEDFYLFNDGGKWYIYMPAMIAGSYLICVLLWLLRRVGVVFSER